MCIDVWRSIRAKLLNFPHLDDMENPAFSRLLLIGMDELIALNKTSVHRPVAITQYSFIDIVKCTRNTLRRGWCRQDRAIP